MFTPFNPQSDPASTRAAFQSGLDRTFDQVQAMYESMRGRSYVIEFDVWVFAAPITQDIIQAVCMDGLVLTVVDPGAVTGGKFTVKCTDDPSHCRRIYDGIKDRITSFPTVCVTPPRLLM